MTVFARRIAAAALAGLAAAGTAASADPPPCTPVAQVSGEPALVDAVVALLGERGIPVSGESDCGTVTVVLATDGARVTITITDADNRGVERTADDVQGAASLIESWARRDVTAPLLAARVAPLPAGQSTDPEAPPVIAHPVVASARPVRRIELAAAVEATISSDGGLWRGARAQGCVQIGAMCAGALFRYSNDNDQRGRAADLNSTRWTFDILLTGDLPLAWGRFTLSPGVGIGQTTIHAEREFFGEEEQDEAAGVHMRGHVAGSYRLVGAWSVELDLAGGYSPFAPRLIGETDREPDDEPPLPGVPRSHASLGIGVSYGGL